MSVKLAIYVQVGKRFDWSKTTFTKNKKCKKYIYIYKIHCLYSPDDALIERKISLVFRMVFLCDPL